jgi:hypothetical protein
MALSNLTLLRAGQLPPVTAYTPAPTSRYTGVTPETQVGFTILGYLTSDSDVMVFQVTSAANTSAGLSINSDTSSDILNVVDTNSSNTQQQISYYSVDFGTDTSGSSWSLSFNITLKDGSTGSWIFTKGKTDDDSIPKY